MMEINGGEVIEVPKTIKKLSGSSTPGEVLPADQKAGWKSAARNPDVAEADSQVAEQENGPEGNHDIPNDDQDPAGEVVVKGEEDAVVEAAVKKAAEAVVGLNLAEDVADEGGAAPDGEAVVNGEIVKADGKKGEENYELDRVAEENSL
jgi:hypothetical protein